MQKHSPGKMTPLSLLPVGRAVKGLPELAKGKIAVQSRQLTAYDHLEMFGRRISVILRTSGEFTEKFQHEFLNELAKKARQADTTLRPPTAVPHPPRGSRHGTSPPLTNAA